PRDAHALKAAAHAEITRTQCGRTGLPPTFCARLATEVQNVDATEWTKLEAHAQIDRGQTACEAAGAAATRLVTLGSAVRAALAGSAVDASVFAGDAIAQNLGRALHTIQDNCAHHGQPNPQHAWHTLRSRCAFTGEDPDSQQEALTCAWAETDQIMAAFV